MLTFGDVFGSVGGLLCGGRWQAEVGGTGVQRTFARVQRGLARVGFPLSLITQRVPLGGDVVTSVSDEVALLGSPLALLFGLLEAHPVSLLTGTTASA
ncbi:MAG TPA: hypothetical protein VFR40_12110 [Lapillicoccus sp.]|nr:hypothetical protein [Lapillicoccus sp.]